MSMLKDCYFLCFVVILIIYLSIKCCILKNEILKQKETFIEILGHDLRVPVIAQIRGLNLIRKDLLLPDSQYYLLDEIKKSCEYTLDMINMLIKIYSIENGDINLKYENFSAYEMLNSILKEYEDIVHDKAIDIICNKDETSFCADKETICKALKILMYIILQHSERNSELKYFISNTQNYFDLTLTYIGKNLSFEEYQRFFSNKSKLSAVGHGIQMYLCKKIIDLHKGKIERLSENKDKMYTFKISVPQHNRAYLQVL